LEKYIKVRDDVPEKGKHLGRIKNRQERRVSHLGKKFITPGSDGT